MNCLSASSLGYNQGYGGRSWWNRGYGTRTTGWGSGWGGNSGWGGTSGWSQGSSQRSSYSARPSGFSSGSRTASGTISSLALFFLNGVFFNSVCRLQVSAELDVDSRKLLQTISLLTYILPDFELKLSRA